jgi:hypothetical protein
MTPRFLALNNEIDFFKFKAKEYPVKCIGDCVRSQDESIGTPFFWPPSFFCWTKNDMYKTIIVGLRNIYSRKKTLSQYVTSITLHLPPFPIYIVLHSAVQWVSQNSSFYQCMQDSRSHPLLPVFTKSSPSLPSLSPFKARSGFLLLISPRGKVFHKPVFLLFPPSLPLRVSVVSVSYCMYNLKIIQNKESRRAVLEIPWSTEPKFLVLLRGVVNSDMLHKCIFQDINQLPPLPFPPPFSYSPFSYRHTKRVMEISIQIQTGGHKEMRLSWLTNNPNKLWRYKCA